MRRQHRAWTRLVEKRSEDGGKPSLSEVQTVIDRDSVVSNPPPKQTNLRLGETTINATTFNIVDPNDLAKRRAVAAPMHRRLWEEEINIAEPLEEFVRWLNED